MHQSGWLRPYKLTSKDNTLAYWSFSVKRKKVLCHWYLVSSTLVCEAMSIEHSIIWPRTWDRCHKTFLFVTDTAAKAITFMYFQNSLIFAGKIWSLPILYAIVRYSTEVGSGLTNKYSRGSAGAGMPHWWGRLSTVDLLVLTSLYHLLLILQPLNTFFTKQATLMGRLTILSLPLQKGFHGWSLTIG